MPEIMLAPGQNTCPDGYQYLPDGSWTGGVFTGHGACQKIADSGGGMTLPQPQHTTDQTTVSPVTQVQVSPQISPVFQQQFQPQNSGMSAGTTQTMPTTQTGTTAPTTTTVTPAPTPGAALPSSDSTLPLLMALLQAQQAPTTPTATVTPSLPSAAFTATQPVTTVSDGGMNLPQPELLSAPTSTPVAVTPPASLTSSAPAPTNYTPFLIAAALAGFLVLSGKKKRRKHAA